MFLLDLFSESNLGLRPQVLLSENGHFSIIVLRRSPAMALSVTSVVACIIILRLLTSSSSFESDELVVDDEFGLEGGRVPEFSPQFPRSLAVDTVDPRWHSDPVLDSKVQFSLEHAFGDSAFSKAGTFSARLKAWRQGGQTLTKLRFSRHAFSEAEENSFKKLLEDDDFYSVRMPNNILTPPGRSFVLSSIKARCLSNNNLSEHFVIHLDGVNIVAVNYGSLGSCEYPRPLKLPLKWTFNSHTVLKSNQQALPRTPVFNEDLLAGDIIEGGDDNAKPPEKSLWAKYWMYVVPLVLIAVNAVTQIMNVPDDQRTGPVASAQRGQSSAAVARRR